MYLYIIISVWIYILFLIGLRSDAEQIALAWPDKSNDKIANSNAKICNHLAVLTFVVLWFLTAFRSRNIGNDTNTYIYLFERFSKGIDISSRYEIGYQYLNYFIGKITTNQHYFLIIIASAAYLGTIVYYRKNSKNILLTTGLFFPIFFTVYTSLIRQQIAMVIILYAYDCIKKKKNTLALLLIAIATAFHSTAIGAVLLFLKNRFIVNNKVVYTISIVCIVIGRLGLLSRIIDVVLPSYSHYFVSRYSSTGWLAVSYDFVRNLILFFLISKYSKTDENHDKLRLMNFALLLIFSSFGFTMNLFIRASEYFMLICTVELPNAIYECNVKNKKYWMLTIGTITIVMFLLILIYRPEWNHIYPYEFWD